MAFAQTYETLWAEPAWLAEARAWIELQLSGKGRGIAGAIEQPHLQLKWHEVRNPVPDKTRDGFDDGLPLRLRRVLELCA